MRRTLTHRACTVAVRSLSTDRQPARRPESSGSARTNALPCPQPRLSAHRSPPCARAISRARYRPRPRPPFGHDIALGVGLCFGLFALDAALEYTISRIIFGLFGDPFAGRTFADFPRPSLTAVVFGPVGVPVGAGIVEEFVYRGYALPRLIALSNRWTGLILMAVGFGWQHVGLPLIVDWRSAAERGLAVGQSRQSRVSIDHRGRVEAP
jgi:hypothetical protein